MIIDIEEELKKVQIKYIQKEIENLRNYYRNLIDVNFLQIVCSHEEFIRIATTTDEKLIFFKKMYSAILNYIFEETQNTSLSEEDLLDINNKDIDDRF